MKILITGTDGYIGKSLCYGLNDYNITGINRKICDLTNSDQVNNFFKDKYFDVVIHCAAAGGSRLKKEDNSIFKNNIKMFENLLHNKDHYKKFIHFGSGAQYNYPLTPYGLSKKLIADMINETPNFYNLIIYGVFDENELDTRFIKANILKCMNDEPMIIHKDKYMDFFHMEDLISLVDTYINNNGNKSIECKYEEVYRLTHIAEMISLILGKVCKIEMKEKGLDKPYMGEDRTSFIAGSFKDRLKETINKVWKR
tara:strand:- start:241 stop:1005 length:765 start_codon:yes stop_codon:yes gene_type:complete